MQMKQRQQPKITVAIRKRPLNKKEMQRGQTDTVQIQQGGQIMVSEIKQKVDLTKYLEETVFNFDYAFNQNSQNQHIYESCIQPLIQNAFEGAKISCFAYGQTGSGKTFTMNGDRQNNVHGLYYLGAREIFQYLNHPSFNSLTVNVSFFEIYCDKLFDLLNHREELKIREDKKGNINIVGIEEKKIYSPQQFLAIIEEGSKIRITAQNATNNASSRSHAILQISLKDGKKLFSKISFIDLAGNERGADHIDQNKQTKIDGSEINKSLLALKECIRALDQAKSHVSFRASKLTMVLKDSFCGYCKTVMIGNISPNSSSSQNTMNTLRYADRVKDLKSKNDVPQTKEQKFKREMMLPRDHKKHCVKIQLNPNDDPEDIEAKKLIARENKKRYSAKPQLNADMDIEEVPNNYNRRKTDFIQPVSHNRDRRSVTPRATEHQDENVFKNNNLKYKNSKETFKKGNQLQLNNNTGNIPHSYIIGFPNISKNQLNFGTSDSQKMKNQLINYYVESIKTQHKQILDERQLIKNITKYSKSQIIEIVQAKINRKMQLLQLLKNKTEEFSGKMNDYDELLNKEAPLFDEQLLSGLNEEEQFR